MRLQWASSALQEEWTEKLKKIQHMISNLELSTVRKDHRKAAIVSAPLGDMGWYIPQEAPLKMFPMDVTKLETYSNETVFPQEGDKVLLRALVSKTMFVEIPKGDMVMGELLGYPECCRRFFFKHWVQDTQRDLLPFQYKLEKGKNEAESSITNNVVLRFMGVRPVFHLPCSSDCVETKKLAALHKHIASHEGFSVAWQNMEELYSQPFSVSSVHGLGEIEHPYFRMMFDGGRLDYQVTFAGLQQSVRVANGYDLFWKDNGFTTVAAMNKGHDSIIAELQQGLTPKTVVDLGAGNGYLVSLVAQFLGAELAHAVEQDTEKVMRGRDLLLRNVEFFNCTIDDYTKVMRPMDMVLISYQRFKEGVNLLNVVDGAKKWLVVYDYGYEVPGEHLEGFMIQPSNNKSVRVYERLNL